MLTQRAPMTLPFKSRIRAVEDLIFAVLSFHNIVGSSRC